MAHFEEIQGFVAIVEAGSITAAAEQLGVGKSALSRRLGELESRLGVELFHRTTRRMNLTDTGEAFYQRCRDILNDMLEAEHSVSQAHHELVGELRVAAPLSFGLMHLGPIITEFAETHPGLHFDVDFNDREVDLLLEGFDLGIRIAELKDSSFMARRIAPIRMVICASPDYLQRHGEPTHPDQLHQHPCLSYRYLANPRQWMFLNEKGKPQAFTVNNTLQANNGEYLTQAAEAGLGILRQPSFLAYQAIQQGTLVPILRDFALPTLHAYAIYPPTRHLSQRVRRFIDTLVERFSGTPYWDQCLQDTEDSRT